MAREDPSVGKAPAAATPADAALADALKLLARRPLTEAELSAGLDRRGHSGSAVRSAVDRLKRSGQIDDRRLALHFIATRSGRLGHGPRRLIEQLNRRGLGPGVAERAWREAVEQGDVDPHELLRRQIRRRLGDGPPRLDQRRYRRVYNALLRAGFEGRELDAELAPLRDGTEEVDDEFA